MRSVYHLTDCLQGVARAHTEVQSTSFPRVLAVGNEMSVELRRGEAVDSEECGRICFQAFKAIADRHKFPQNFPSAEVASELLTMFLAHPGVQRRR